MALEGSVQSHRSDRLFRSQALIFIQHLPSVPNYPRDGIVDLSDRIYRLAVVIGMQGRPAIVLEGSPAAVNQIGSLLSHDDISEGVTVVIDMADEETWINIELFHPGELLLPAESGVLSPVPHVIPLAVLLGIFEGIQGHIDGSVSIAMNTNLPSLNMGFKDCLI